MCADKESNRPPTEDARPANRKSYEPGDEINLNYCQTKNIKEPESSKIFDNRLPDRSSWAIRPFRLIICIRKLYFFALNCFDCGTDLEGK